MTRGEDALPFTLAIDGERHAIDLQPRALASLLRAAGAGPHHAAPAG